MARTRTIAVAIILFSFFPTVAWSQYYFQPYPFGYGMQAGANTAQTAGANTAWTAGPTPYLGTAGGQYYPQPLFGAPYGIGTGVGRFYQTFGSVAPSYVISSTPWFSNVTLRERLALNDLQYQNLYGAYVDAWTRYNQAVAQLPANMALAERAGQLQALEAAFNTEFNTAVEANITDAQALQQFNNLRVQYQDQPRANKNAAPMSLALTDEQKRRLRLMAYQWNQLMARLRERAAKDSSVTDAEFDALRRQAQLQIESTLTPAQLPFWPELVGPFYDFSGEWTTPQRSSEPKSPSQKDQSQQAPAQSAAPASEEQSSPPSDKSTQPPQ
jgi:hypothetical protein